MFYIEYKYLTLKLLTNMEVIENNTAGDAWVAACKKVITQGEKIFDNKTELKEVLDLFVIVEDGVEVDEIIENMAILLW